MDNFWKIINIDLELSLIFYINKKKKVYISQNGSVVNETLNKHFLLLLISLIHALTVSPFTSISQAPQVPVRQPVGISKPAFSAEENQSSPSETNVSLLFGQIIFIFVCFKLKMMWDLNVYWIHPQDYQ